MSEYFLGKHDDTGPLDPPTGRTPKHAATPVRGRHAATPARGRHAAPEHVRLGVPFNGVVPIWHDGTDITWHRATDGTDFATVLGLGVVETEPGPSPTPEGWVEVVETGTLLAPGADSADSADGVDAQRNSRARSGGSSPASATSGFIGADESVCQ